MLLIGSRAIRHHVPEFREPKDWDLIGTDEDIARLDRLLPRSDFQPPGSYKVFYIYQERLVEVANASLSPYWQLIQERFKACPKIADPVLGEMVIPPLSYLLLTKQCGLIYRVVHWHKNLEDLFFLLDRVPTIEDEVADLLRHTLEDSKRMFGASHARSARGVRGCHPALEAPRDELIHGELHRRYRHLRSADVAEGETGRAALVERPPEWFEHAWRAFPEVLPSERRALMIELLAEEAWVLAAEEHLAPSVDGKEHPEDELVRWALRELLTSSLPEGWRYFGVNHYREIAARIPRLWKEHLRDLAGPPIDYSRCEASELMCEGGL